MSLSTESVQSQIDLSTYIRDLFISEHDVYMFEHTQRLRLAVGVSPSTAYFKSDVELILGRSWKGLTNCPPNTVYGPLFSIAIVQDRPKETKKKEGGGKQFVQKFLVLQSDESNNMQEIVDHAEVSYIITFGLLTAIRSHFSCKFVIFVCQYPARFCILLVCVSFSFKHIFLQNSYPCCNAFEHNENWTDVWMCSDNYSVWLHPKDLKHAHNLVFCDDQPLVYAPLVE